MGRIAIVGAGLAGLVCGRRLHEAGHEVVVFDKARGAGGRLTTRRRDEHRFDHGAQYFTVRDSAFGDAVETWHRAGIVAPWEGRFALEAGGRFSSIVPHTLRWVGTPRMSMIGRHLAASLDVRLSHRVTALASSSTGWTLQFQEHAAEGPFAAVVVACPGPQAAALLPEESPTHSAAAALAYAPCWAAMLRFEHPVELPYDGMHFESDLLGWAARDSSKPGRAPGERWVLHAAPDWSQRFVDAEPTSVQSLMVDRFYELTGAQPCEVMVHRWRYALATALIDTPAILDRERGLGLCGDALGAPRVEGAFVSGMRMGAALLGVGDDAQGTSRGSTTL